MRTLKLFRGGVNTGQLVGPESLRKLNTKAPIGYCYTYNLAILDYTPLPSPPPPPPPFTPPPPHPTHPPSHPTHPRVISMQAIKTKRPAYPMQYYVTKVIYWGKSFLFIFRCPFQKLGPKINAMTGIAISIICPRWWPSVFLLHQCPLPVGSNAHRAAT